MTKELQYPGLVKRGSRGMRARRIQEWLCLHGHHVVVDGRFGPATEAALREFQRKKRKLQSGTVTRATFSALVQPMAKALAPLKRVPARLGTAVVRHARLHLAQRPREVGGQNRGPWVRLYMDGNEGEAWPWCAGFVSFIVRQACDTLDIPMPFAGTFTCDTLASQGSASGRFFSGAAARSDLSLLRPGTIFLLRATGGNWTHTGLLTRVESPEVFATIEGNTNDDGDREGYEVCARKRGFAGKDFVAIS